jgi:hypothetical protein
MFDLKKAQIVLELFDKLNKVSNYWSITYDGSRSENEALLQIQQIVQEINQEVGCDLIIPDQLHMEKINQHIGDIELSSDSLEDIVSKWNSLAKNNA